MAGEIGVLIKSLLLVLEKSQSLVFSDMMTSTIKQAHKQEIKPAKAKENGEGERRMKTANVKWGRGKQEATGNKIKCKRRVCETYLDRSWFLLPGNGARNTSDVCCVSLATVPEIVVSTAPGILQLRLCLKGLPRQVCKGFPPRPWSLALVFPRSGKGDVAQRW